MKPRVFQATEIASIIRMPSSRISKFAETAAYGLKPSVSHGGKQGTRRLYSQTDLLRIAVAWWLYQGGLRAQVIDRVLKASKVKDAIRDSKGWTHAEHSGLHLVLRREITDHEKPNQAVELRQRSEIGSLAHEGHSIQVIPIGALLLQVWENLRPNKPKGGQRL
ncbi:MAG: hypothetical protein O2968_22965 [Acidobacteria bacterium]|nr:hypothetical protein [Acidobacteriota bacterium]